MYPEKRIDPILLTEEQPEQVVQMTIDDPDVIALEETSARFGEFLQYSQKVPR